MQYTIRDLQTDFPDDNACLEWLINYRFPDGVICTKCNKVTKHYKDKGRKSYSCGVCGRHFHPTAGTILHKSSTPLTLWFYLIFVMTSTKSGVSAGQIQRELGVTYKCAWRMMHQVRKMMNEQEGQLSGEVEMDETYIHANVYKRSTARQRYGLTGARSGQVLFGMVERNGRVKVRHVMTNGARIIRPIIDAEVAKGSKIYSDEAWIYQNLHKQGYRHATTNHSRNEHVHPANPLNHIQNIENFWSTLKPRMKGVYKNVSAQHLQKYANEYAWRYSYRSHPSIFWVLMAQVAEPSPDSCKTAF